MKNRSNKEVIRAFKELTADLKSRGINPGFHFMDNEASKDLKMTITTMDIKYKLVPPSNHRSNNKERSILTFKYHFIAVLWIIYIDFYLQLWYRLLQETIFSINLLRESVILPNLLAYTHMLGDLDYNRTLITLLFSIVGLNVRYWCLDKKQSFFCSSGDDHSLCLEGVSWCFPIMVLYLRAQ